jgi:hypothetical protein
MRLVVLFAIVVVGASGGGKLLSRRFTTLVVMVPKSYIHSVGLLFTLLLFFFSLCSCYQAYDLLATDP